MEVRLIWVNASFLFVIWIMTYKNLYSKTVQLIWENISYYESVFYNRFLWLNQWNSRTDQRILNVRTITILFQNKSFINLSNYEKSWAGSLKNVWLGTLAVHFQWPVPIEISQFFFSLARCLWSSEEGSSLVKRSWGFGCVTATYYRTVGTFAK